MRTPYNYMKMSYAVRSFSVRYLIHDARGIEFVRSTNPNTAYIRSEGKVKKLKLGRTCIDTATRVDTNTFRIQCEYSADEKLRNFRHMFGLEYEVSRKKGGNFIVKDNILVHALDLGSLSMPSFKEVIFVLDISAGISRKLHRKVVAGMVSMLYKMVTGDLVDYLVIGETHSFYSEARGLQDVHDLQRLHTLPCILMGRMPGGKAIFTLALVAAIRKLRQAHRVRYNPFILLMSCGFPLENTRTTASEILTEVAKWNTDVFPIFSMVLGRFNHFAFFERLSNENFGFATKIYDTDDLESQMVKAFEKISRPSLRNVKIEYPRNAVPMSTNNIFPVVLQGTEILICGELRLGTTPFQYDIQYDNRESNRRETKTFSTGDFHSDTTADALKKLWTHVGAEELSGQYHRLNVSDRNQLKNHLAIKGRENSLLMASLNTLTLIRGQVERFDPESLTLTPDGSVATPEISLGPPGYHAAPLTGLQRSRKRGQKHRGSSGRGSRKQKARKNRNCSQSSRQHIVLSLVTLSIPKQHPWNHTVRGICMVPQHVVCDLFTTIIKYKGGTEIFVVQNSIATKPLRIYNLKAVYVREENSAADALGQYHGGMKRRSLQGQHGSRIHTVISFDRDNKLEVSSQETLHTITETSEDEIIVSTPSLDITMRRVCRPRAIVIKIHVSPGQFFDGTKLSGGLLVNFIKMEQEELITFFKWKARKRCKKDVASSLFPIIAGDNGGTRFCDRNI